MLLSYYYYHNQQCRQNMQLKFQLCSAFLQVTSVKFQGYQQLHRREIRIF